MLIILIIICSTFILYLTKKPKCGSSGRAQPTTKNLAIPKRNGICYFDIDDTLTTSISEADSLMKECLNNNFDIGIITASNRSINHICNGPIAGGFEHDSNKWMSSILCKHFKDTNNVTFNNSMIVAGKPAPINLPVDKLPLDPHHIAGYMKGYSMNYGKNLLYPDMPDKCVVLFDDQQDYIDGVKRFNNNLEVQCANYACGGIPLSIDTVRNKISSMKKAGCK